MNEKKPRRSPQVEVLRRPATAPSPAPSTPSSRPSTGRPRRSGPPRPPPTPEQIHALAKREHVPARIARGELEGKMKCRIWRKLHAEEARRFDRVYDLMEKNSELGFEDAFGVLQSGLPPAVFLERKAKAQKKAAVKQARGAIAGEAIDAFLQGMIQQKAELSVVLAERTLQDVLRSLERVALVFERGGRLEKLQVILISRRTVWDKLTGSLERDPKLADNPSPIIRQPERRPVSDPRPFLPHVGQTIDCVLRNGLMLKQPLRTVGPFDLLLGSEEAELFVPLHAIVRWAAAPLP